MTGISTNEKYIYQTKVETVTKTSWPLALLVPHRAKLNKYLYNSNIKNFKL